MRIPTVLLLLTIFSCSQPKKTQNYEQYLTQKIEPRDSMYILYTARQWGERNWDSWGIQNHVFRITSEEVEFYIGGTFYSPDRKLILVWVGKKMPNAPTIEMYSPEVELNRICPRGEDTIYDLSALIGIRDSIAQPWVLYPFDQQSAICCGSKEVAINILSQYYFSKMKTHPMYRMEQTGDQKGMLKSTDYGYNLQDKDFWSKCWLFQKDTVGSYGLYPFQINRYNGEFEEKCSKDCAEEFKLPIIEYPKEILQLYK